MENNDVYGYNLDTTPTRVEVKVIASTAGSFAAGLGVAILNATLADTSLLGRLPAWLQFVLIMFGPALVTFLSGFVKGSTTSRASTSYIPSAK